MLNIFIKQPLDFFLKRINIKNVNVILSLGAITVLLSHTLFSVGLYDGPVNLFEMILYEKIQILEISRAIFEIFQSFFALIFITKFSSSSIPLLIYLFSFGLIWIHIFSLIGCYFILPKQQKNMIFFPLFAFFTGPVISLHISISVGLSVCSYVWLLAYIIYYSDLSNKIHKALFVLVPLPLILSYELMSYMALPLIALCWYKSKTETGKWYKGLLWFVQIYLIIVFVVQMVMTIFHDRITNAGDEDLDIVIKEITHFDFLFEPSFNFLLVLTILILFYCFVQLYKDSIHNKAKVKLQFIELSIFLSFILTLIMSVLQIKDDFIFDYTIRFYPPVIALPCGLFLWWICEQKKVDIEKWGREGKNYFYCPVVFLF